tara:strand:+ start:72 stop:302 length:231 start_codon:yes stop_codon:yes gene_type:complete
MDNESKKYDAYGIRLEVLKNAKEMVWETWHMEKEELQSNTNFENSSTEIPPIPTTREVLEVASDFYNFVENGGKSS